MRAYSGLLLFLALAVLLAGRLAAREAASDTYLPLVVRAPAPFDTVLTSATYLGGFQDDTSAATVIAPDGTIVLGAELPDYVPPGGVPVYVLPGGKAAVLRFDPSGRTLHSLSRVGDGLTDLAVDSQGNILACGAFGVTMLDPTGALMIWNDTPGFVQRCAVGFGGQVAALVEQRVLVYTANGIRFNDFAVADSATMIADLAFDHASPTLIIAGSTRIATGFDRIVLQGWSLQGVRVWEAYNTSAGQLNDARLRAGTRGDAVTIGVDGFLYLAATVAGVPLNSVFARDPRDFGVTIAPQRYIATDLYNDPDDKNAVTTWFGRYNPQTGDLLLGSALAVRDADGRYTSIGARAIAADEQGRLALAGTTLCCIEARDRRTLALQPVGAYEANEAFLLVLSSDFRRRQIWTPFAAANASGGNSPATGVALRGGVVAAALTFTPEPGINRNLATFQALQPVPVGGTDAYLAVGTP